MQLRDLDAHLLGRYKFEDDHIMYTQVSDIKEAQGIQFQCPKCAIGKERGINTETGLGYYIGVHSVICWFAKPLIVEPVPIDADPKPGRWYFTGDSIDNITFTGPGASSVLLLNGCNWHGFVKNGTAE